MAERRLPENAEQGGRRLFGLALEAEDGLHRFRLASPHRVGARAEAPSVIE